MSYRKNVVAVVVRGDGILLVRKERQWKFPQGGIEDGETPERAALREAREELGIDTKKLSTPSKLSVTHSYPFERPDKDGYEGKEQVFFAMVFLGTDKDMVLGDELAEYRWVSIPELVDTIAPEEREAAQKILEVFGLMRKPPEL